MHRIAALIRDHAKPLARLVVQEQGKPIAHARGEIGCAAEFFTYFAEFARRIQGEILPSDIPGEHSWIQRVPVGVLVGIIPWHYPAALASRKVAPALIDGNTIVLIPHEETPLSALYMARLMAEAGVPDGVMNIVTGGGATVGAALTSHPGVDLITMTGSVQTGRRIMQAAAGNLVPVSLELGGKAPFIVMEDADLDQAVAAAVTPRFMNCGQVCICAERILVHERTLVSNFGTTALALVLAAALPAFAQDLPPEAAELMNPCRCRQRAKWCPVTLTALRPLPPISLPLPTRILPR